MRFFNTEGPVVAAKHYCIPPLSRVNRAEVLGRPQGILPWTGGDRVGDVTAARLFGASGCEEAMRWT